MINTEKIKQSKNELSKYGWNSFFDEAFISQKTKDLKPARVSLQHRNKYKLLSETKEIWARVSGKIFYKKTKGDELPAIGDWVLFKLQNDNDLALIKQILPRKSKFSRKVAGSRTEEQVIVANMDTVFLVSGLDEEFNLRRIERYLIVAEKSGAAPVIILNKTDICNSTNEKLKDVKRIAKKIPVLTTSALKNQGIDKIGKYLKKGKTGVFLGSSGVGKSTIINLLFGREIQKVNDLRTDGKGKHTTTQRELMVHPSGCMIIDTPGLRELHLLDDYNGIDDTFDDIKTFAENCRFRNCSHMNEPDCGVKLAVENGNLNTARLKNYQKIMKEVNDLKTRQTRSIKHNMREKKFFKKKDFKVE